jgi:hypothetical protein
MVVPILEGIRYMDLSLQPVLNTNSGECPAVSGVICGSRFHNRNQAE